jgi:basic membrane protein A
MDVSRRTRALVALIAALSLAVVVIAGCAGGATTGGGEAAKTGGAAKLKTAMVTDVGGLGDKSFNDAAWAGLEKAKAELGADTKVLESKEIADYETNLSQLATAGYKPVFAVGFLMTDTVTKLSTAYPDAVFAGVDEVFADPIPKNVIGLNFKENEGAYLAGVAAGLALKDKAFPGYNGKNTAGFVGGMDVPVIEKFRAGFEAGMKSVNPTAKLISVYAGNFNDQPKGKELGLQVISQGASIVFPAAGATGLGTIQACVEKNVPCIGVDVDQFLTVPQAAKVMFTSVMKGVETAVFDTIKKYSEGTLKTGVNEVYGVKEGGMSLAPFHDFEKYATPEMKAAIDKAKAGIIDGSITVPESGKK